MAQLEDDFDLDAVSDSKEKEDELNSYSRGQHLLQDFEEENKQGYKMRVPIKNEKAKNNNPWNDDGIEEDIEEEHLQ